MERKLKGQLSYIKTGSGAFGSGGADKYHGQVAQSYDTKREGTPKYDMEQEVISKMLEALPLDSIVLDVPCGTGRFLPVFKERGFKVLAMDKSAEMVALATTKAKALDPSWESWVQFGVGSVLATSLSDDAVHVSVMCRLSRWLSPEEFYTALVELQRVTSHVIILTMRIAGSPYAKTFEMLENAIQPGWKIHQHAGSAEDESYRVVEIRKTDV